MVSNELKESYKGTTFKVFQPRIEIRIDKINPELESLLSENDIDEWSYITADNPYSKQLSDEQNKQRFQELVQMAGIYSFYEGEGVGEDPAWKPEKSILIIGITRDKAISIGNYFEQNAIVVGRKGNPAELLMLK